MQPLKQSLLRAWYLGTQPWRKAIRAWQARTGRCPVAVLFYHRVADDHPNDWTLPSAEFARQIAWLRRNFELISLEEAQRRIRAGENRRPAASITFDDGYADNCEFALPLLVRERIPCTYFVTLNNVLFGDPFPHDAALGRPLRPNTLEQLRTLAAAGIEIGAHTRTHADLGGLRDERRVYDEVVTATHDLAEALGRPVRYFAFPYGLPANLRASAFLLARKMGLDGVCSAYGGYNFPGDDPFHLLRFHADTDFLRFQNWLTGDPRKYRMPRFEYERAWQHGHEANESGAAELISSGGSPPC